MRAVAGAARFGRNETAPQVHTNLPSEESVAADLETCDVPRQTDQEPHRESDDQIETEQLQQPTPHQEIERDNNSREHDSENTLREDAEADRDCSKREMEPAGRPWLRERLTSASRTMETYDRDG